MADERDEPDEEREPTEGAQIVGDEKPALRLGPDDTGPLPHWTEPPTGEVPKILADEPHDDVDPWSSFSGQAPVWRDDQSEDANVDLDLTPLTEDLPPVDPGAVAICSAPARSSRPAERPPTATTATGERSRSRRSAPGGGSQPAPGPSRPHHRGQRRAPPT
jgi:phosphatidate cytidylyltransferase